MIANESLQGGAMAVIRDHVLKAQQFRETGTLPRELLVLDGYWSANQLAEDLVVSLSATIYGQDIGEHSYQVPADWWQHWKLQHAPAWLKRRWPVQYRRHTLNAVALFPEYRPPSSRLGGPQIIFREYGVSR